MIIIFEHHALYVKSIQVEHSGELGREQRERTRCCRLGREGENEGVERERENGVGFKLGSALVDFD
jgi:hypothetical protein